MTKKYTLSFIDLHTDFILAEAGLGKKIFNIDTSSQINKSMLKKSKAKLIFSGFSYDNENNCTEEMLQSMLKFKKTNPKFNIIFHIEGAEILTKQSLDYFYKNGVRSIGIAHTHNNSLTGSSSSTENSGLTNLGKNVIKKALSKNILIDLAHMNSKAIEQTLKLIGKLPPFLSHTACFEIEPNPRNISDRQIKEISKRDGVIGIFFSNKYIDSSKKPTTKDVANHVEHLIKVGGIDCAAIGSDFGGITTGTPTNLESIDKIHNLFNELADRGFTQKDLEKIAYKNAERVIKKWNPNLIK